MWRFRFGVSFLGRWMGLKNGLAQHYYGGAPLTTSSFCEIWDRRCFETEFETPVVVRGEKW